MLGCFVVQYVAVSCDLLKHMLAWGNLIPQRGQTWTLVIYIQDQHFWNHTAAGSGNTSLSVAICITIILKAQRTNFAMDASTWNVDNKISFDHVGGTAAYLIRKSCKSKFHEQSNHMYMNIYIYIHTSIHISFSVQYITNLQWTAAMGQTNAVLPVLLVWH